MTPRELCFVIMSYGRKTTPSGRIVDFDVVYRDAIKPAIEDAGLEPIRADEEVTDGVIHTAMFERLVLCPFALADLTSAGANVFYELGVRHAAKPYTTLLIYANSERAPFDVNLLRAHPYELSDAGVPADAASMRAMITERLRVARRIAAESPVPDSPLFAMLAGYPNMADSDATSLRDRMGEQQRVRQSISDAIHLGAGALATLQHIEAELGALEDAASAIIVDLYKGYREIEEWDAMEALFGRMSRVLQSTVFVREQRALCLNRMKRDTDAEGVLKQLIAEHGPNGERCGLLGRIYKDRWERELRDNRMPMAQLQLRAAVNQYIAGFESGDYDTYPGINALTLMEIGGGTDPRLAELLPVVRYVARRRLAGRKPDYWDHATNLELAVLARDRTEADRALEAILPLQPTRMQATSTAGNLAMIVRARAARNEETGWIADARALLLESARVDPATLPLA